MASTRSLVTGFVRRETSSYIPQCLIYLLLKYTLMSFEKSGIMNFHDDKSWFYYWTADLLSFQFEGNEKIYSSILPKITHSKYNLIHQNLTKNNQSKWKTTGHILKSCLNDKSIYLVVIECYDAFISGKILRFILVKYTENNVFIVHLKSVKNLDCKEMMLKPLIDQETLGATLKLKRYNSFNIIIESTSSYHKKMKLSQSSLSNCLNYTNLKSFGCDSYKDCIYFQIEKMEIYALK